MVRLMLAYETLLWPTKELFLLTWTHRGFFAFGPSGKVLLPLVKEKDVIHAQL